MNTTIVNINFTNETIIERLNAFANIDILQAINCQFSGFLITNKKRGKFEKYNPIFYHDLFTSIAENIYTPSRVELSMNNECIIIKVSELQSCEEEISYDISYIYPLTDKGAKYTQDNFNTELEYEDFQHNNDMFGTL
jgi:hypothetical protein